MTDIVYWGNGDQTLGEYSAPKDVSQALKGEQPSGITVDWGGGDTDKIPGKSWGANLYPKSYSGTYRRDGSTRSFSGNLPLGATEVSGSIASFPRRSWNFSHCGLNNSGSVTVPYLQFNNSDKSPISSGFPTCVLTNANWRSVNRGDRRALSASQYSSFTTPVISEIIQAYQVVSDAGAISERVATAPPDVSLQDSKCVIAITYEDGTNEEIPLNSCPEWVRIRSDEECPENTCRVDCGDHYCCYGCDGKPVKEIPK